MPHSTPPVFARARLILWFASAGLATVIGLSVLAATSYVAANRWVDHTIRVVEAMDDWLVTLYDAHTGARGYALSGDRASLEPFQRAERRERLVAAELKALVADNAHQAQSIARADRVALSSMEGSRSLISLVEAGRRDEAFRWIATGESMRRIDTFRTEWREIRAEEERLLSARRTEARARALLTAWAAGLMACVSFGLVVLAWRLQLGRAQALAALARGARERLLSLSSVAVALSNARSRSDVAEVVVEDGMRVAGADTSTLYLLDESKTTLQLVGERGVAQEVVNKLRRLDKASSSSTFDSLEAGESLWVETEEEYAKLFPGLAKLSATGPRARAFWSVPLVVEGERIGLLGMGFYEPRTFSADDRVLVETLCRQCAQALLRAQRLEREEEARQWLQTTLTSIGDAVVATDTEGRVTFMNAVAEALTGWTASDARGRPLDQVFAIFSETTREPVESPVAKVLREGTVVGLANHTVLRARNGREVPIDDSGAPIKNARGELFGVVLVFRDVSREKTERVRREFLTKAMEALVSSLDYEVTLATIARLAVPVIADWCAVEIALPDGRGTRQAAVAHIDPHKVRFARALGERYPPDPNAKTGVPEVIRSGKAQLYKEIPSALIDAAAKDGEHLRLLRELDLRSGMVVPLFANGRVHGAMSFVYAESNRRYTDDDLAFAEDFARRAAMAIENSLSLRAVEQARENERRLRADAEVASRAKDEFLAMVSHELRTPLNAILGWAVMLRRRDPSAETDRGLAIIERNAQTQAKLIEDVLDVSRIISGKLSLSLGPTSVGDAVTAALDTVGPAAQGKDITVSAELSPDLPPITADPDRIQQVVWNLLSNAVKFTPKGGTISVRAFREGSEVCIVVRDTGGGIPADALPFIFDLFQQADGSTTRRHGGLGLGLAIVKQLVQAHGGSVRAESAGPGRGATFVVSIPARAAVSAMIKVPRTTTLDRAGDRPPPPRLDGLRVLVVDDEEDALALVCEALRDRGADVQSAASVAQALEAFKSRPPDVLVSDIGMPGEDGYSLVRKVRALSASQGGRTPAVALTAYARAEDAQRAFAAGYEMHVPKPAAPDQLLSVVANLGGRSLEPS